MSEKGGGVVFGGGEKGCICVLIIARIRAECFLNFLRFFRSLNMRFVVGNTVWSLTGVCSDNGNSTDCQVPAQQCITAEILPANVSL